MNTQKAIGLASLLLAIFPLLGIAQERHMLSGKYEVGLNYLHGFVIKHDRYMGHLSKGITRGVEVSFAKKAYGKNSWQRLAGYPDVGLSLSYFDYPSPILGQTLALNSFSDYYLVRTSRFYTTFRMGIGLGFHTKPYDKETNNKNVVYGSPVTFSIISKLNLKYKFSERWLLNGSVGMYHFSFADLKRPNKGLNVLEGNLGIKHLIGEKKEEVGRSEIDREFSRKLRYSLNVNGSIVNYKVVDSKVYPMISISTHVQKSLSRLFDIQFGIDLFNNRAMVEVIKDDGDIDDGKLPDHKKVGVSAGAEYHMDKISLQFNVGYYLYAPYKGPYGSFYQRYGLKFYASEHIYINTGFKSHRADAENAEFGLGYRF